MSRNTIDLEFADGNYMFALPLPRIDELQQKCFAGSGVQSGIGQIFARVLKGCAPVVTDEGIGIAINPNLAEFYATDIVETIRQGLIGGGAGVVDGTEVKVTPALANRLIENYVLAKPLGDSWSLAASILGACILGYDPPKKD